MHVCVCVRLGVCGFVRHLCVGVYAYVDVCIQQSLSMYVHRQPLAQPDEVAEVASVDLRCFALRCFGTHSIAMTARHRHRRPHEVT